MNLQKYRKNPAWTLLIQDEKLIASGGQDEVYLIDELDIDIAKELMSIYETTDDVFESVDQKFLPLFQKLQLAGILNLCIPKNPNLNVLRYNIVWCGDKDEILEKSILAAKYENIQYDQVQPDISVYIRTNALLKDCLDEAYLTVKHPHILLDLASSHTISLGPLVFPGYTACLGCITGKIQYYWGDLPIPKEPKLLKKKELINSLLFDQLSIFLEYGTIPALVNTLVSWDLTTMKMNHDTILKLPWCPFCGEKKTEKFGLGSFELPWHNVHN